MKKLLILLLLLLPFTLIGAEGIRGDQIITVYSDNKAINAEVLYSVIIKFVYQEGVGYTAGIRIIKDWGDIEPFRPDYYYFASETITPYEVRIFY